PAGSALSGRSTRSFVWTWSVSGAGTLAFTAGASGKEANTGNTIAPVPITSSTVVVQSPAALSLSVAATPAKVSAGLQRVSLALALKNQGGASLRLDALRTPTVTTTGTAAAMLASAPASPAGTLLAGGAATTFTWQYDVSGSGTISLSASASGTDANSGTAVAPGAMAASAVTVQKPAALTLSASLNSSTLSAGLQKDSPVVQDTNPGQDGAVCDRILATTSRTTESACSSSAHISPTTPR